MLRLIKKTGRISKVPVARGGKERGKREIKGLWGLIGKGDGERSGSPERFVNRDRAFGTVDHGDTRSFDSDGTGQSGKLVRAVAKEHGSLFVDGRVGEKVGNGLNAGRQSAVKDKTGERNVVNANIEQSAAAQESRVQAVVGKVICKAEIDNQAADIADDFGVQDFSELESGGKEASP